MTSTSEDKELHLLTADDVAARIGVSRGAVLKMRERGQLPKPVKVGGRLRWRSDTFDQWLRSLPVE